MHLRYHFFHLYGENISEDPIKKQKAKLCPQKNLPFPHVPVSVKNVLPFTAEQIGNKKRCCQKENGIVFECGGKIKLDQRNQHS